MEADTDPKEDICSTKNVRKVEPGSDRGHDCSWSGGGFCRNGDTVLRKANRCLGKSSNLQSSALNLWAGTMLLG